MGRSSSKRLWQGTRRRSFRGDVGTAFPHAGLSFELQHSSSVEHEQEECTWLSSSLCSIAWWLRQGWYTSPAWLHTLEQCLLVDTCSTTVCSLTTQTLLTRALPHLGGFKARQLIVWIRFSCQWQQQQQAFHSTHQQFHGRFPCAPNECERRSTRSPQKSRPLP